MLTMRVAARFSQAIALGRRSWVSGRDDGVIVIEVRSCHLLTILATSNSVTEHGRALPLRFPAFNKATANTREWDAAEDSGRIKVELAAGYATERDGTSFFTPMSTVVCFSFLPAPLGE